MIKLHWKEVRWLLMQRELSLGLLKLRQLNLSDSEYEKQSRLLTKQVIENNSFHNLYLF